MTNSNANKPLNDNVLGNLIRSEPDYKVLPENWYTAKPYGFKFTDKNSNVIVMFLPLGPSNISITTNFATNIVTTLYGTVEEHSPVRYYDISLEGTTGMTPKYVEPFHRSDNPKENPGRASFSVKIDTKGFFGNTLQAANNIAQSSKDLIGQNTSASTGLYLDQTGYMAFHNLYRFLLAYKKDVAGQTEDKYKTRIQDSMGNDVHPLIFFNYKDNNQYKVAVRTFNLRRDKDDPMLYNYSISMRGYGLSTVDEENLAPDVQNVLTDLGLNGVNDSSRLTQIKKKAADAKQILGLAAAGITQLGR